MTGTSLAIGAITKRLACIAAVFLASLPAAAQQGVSSSPPDLTAQHLFLPLLAPPAPTASGGAQLTGNAGPGTYFYWIVSSDLAGFSTPAGPFIGQGAPNALSASNYFIISWAPASNALSYDVLRTTSRTMPQGVCNCAVATGVNGTSANDQSNSLSAYTVAPLDPNTLLLSLDNEAQGMDTSHLILRQNGNFVSDLSVAAISANATSLQGKPLDTDVGSATTPGALIALNPAGYISQIKPLLDVRDYGAICDGSNDDSTAIQSAVTAAHAIGFAVSLPSGICLANGLRLQHDVALFGQGKEATVLALNDATANLMTVQGNGYSCPRYPCNGQIHDLTLAGNGHLTTGTLLELDQADSFALDHVKFYNHGGRCLQINDSSERFGGTDLDVDFCRWPVIAAGNINESYFKNLPIISPGQDAGGYCWNINCVAGVYPASGAISPDIHAAFYSYNAVNLSIDGASFKPLKMLAGAKFWIGENDRIQNAYFEGYPNDQAPRVNASVIAGGVGESTTTTGSLASGGMSVAVASTMWMPQYFTNPSDAVNVYPYPYVIYPPDFIWGSSAASSLGGSILKGSYEIVNAIGFAGDGNLYLSARAQNGTTALTWPLGAVVAVKSGVWSSAVTIRDSHLNAIQPPGTGYSDNCDDTGPLTCGEIIAGYVPGGWVQPRGAAGDSTTAKTVYLGLDHIHIWGVVPPAGTIKVHYGAIIDVASYPGLELLESSVTPNAVDMSDTGQTGSQIIAAPAYGSDKADLQISMPAIGKYTDNQANTGGGMYTRITSYSAAMFGRQFANSWTFFDWPSSGTQPLNRWTFTGGPMTAAGGFSNDVWSGTAWINAFNMYQSSFGSWFSISAPAANKQAALNLLNPNYPLGWSTLLDNNTGNYQIYNANTGVNATALSIDWTTSVVTAANGFSGALNGTVGATTAAAGKFTTLSASGQFTSTETIGTAPFVVASTTPVANLTGQVLLYNHSGTQLTNAHCLMDSCVLGSTCSVTLTGASVFTTSTSYTVACQDNTAIDACNVVQSSGSAFAITGNSTDTIRYLACGN